MSPFMVKFWHQKMLTYYFYLYYIFRFFCESTLNIVNALVDVETLRIVIKSRAFYQANNFVVVLHCRYLLTEIIGMYT